MEHLKSHLRFQEFKDDWGLYSLRDFIAKIESGWSPVCLNEIGKKGEWGSLKTTSSSWEGYFPNENKKLPNNLKPRLNIEVVIDDILITRVGPFDRVGVVAHVNKDWKHLMVSDNMFRLKLKGEIFPAFVPLILGSFNVQICWKQKIAGLASAQVVINQQTIFSTKLTLPSLNEQTKIANFLSSIDEKLNLLKEKKSLLEDFKKGIMQKIFNQEIRFKDDNGNDFAKWEELIISELTEVIVGGTPSTSKEEYWNGNIAWLSSGELNNGLVSKARKYITETGLKNSSAKIMKANTVLLAMTGATLGKMGFLTFDSSGNQSIAGFHPNETYDSKFLFYTLLHNKNTILSMAGGAAQQGINKAAIESLTFSFCCLEEQTKIGNFLSAIDEKINLVSNQIQDTQEYKKGLLQKMFV